MAALLCEMNYGNEIFNYQIIFSRRKTLAIIINPDQTILVKAPMNANLRKIQQKVCNKAGWIKNKIQYFEQFRPRIPPRQYVGGETHLYLGKPYRLKLFLGEKNHVLLQEDFLHVICKESLETSNVKKNLENWYRKQAKALFEEFMAHCWQQFNYLQEKPPKLSVRKMKTRWGSLSLKTLTVTLNSELIKASRECIEYVIFHEFCHLQNRFHDKQFYRMLKQILPDWKERKLKLETSLT